MATGRSNGLDASTCEYLPDGVAHYGPDGRLRFWNAAYAEAMRPLELVADSRREDNLAAIAATRVAAGDAGDAGGYVAARLEDGSRSGVTDETFLNNGRRYALQGRQLPDGGWLETVREVGDADATLQTNALLADAAPLLVAVFDGEDRLLTWNRSFAEHFANLTGRLPEHGETQSSLAEARGSSLGLSGTELEDYVRTSNNRHRALEPSTQSVGGRHFEITKTRSPEGGIVTVSRDITARKEAQAAEEAAAMLLRSVLDVVPYQLVYFDPERRLRLWNSAFVDWQVHCTGIAPQDGDRFEDLARARFASRGAAETEIEAELQRRLRSFGKPDEMTTAANGREWRLRYLPAPDGGTVSAAVDVTAVVHAQRDVAVLLAAVPVPMVLVDAAGAVRSCNHEAHGFLGYATGELEQLLPLQWVEHADRPGALAAVRALASDPDGPQLHENLELTVERADGTRLPVALVLAAVLSGEGTQVAMVLIDISERVIAVREKELREKRAEELEDLNTELARTNEQLDAFAAVAAHDLRAPLRRIRQFGSLLERRAVEQLDPRNLDYLHRISASARQLDGTIEDLLTYAKSGSLDAGDVSTFDARCVVDEVIDTLQPMVEEKQAEITVEPLGSLTTRYGDVRLIVQNLVVNALTYVVERTPVVTVGLSETPDGPCLSVTDNGIGIPADKHAAIFAPMRRLHSASEFEGTGLGLSICAKLAERNEGRIDLQSTPGEGTTFRVLLPRLS